MTIISVYGETIGEVIESAPFNTVDELLNIIGFNEESLCSKYGWDSIDINDIEVIR